MKSKDEIISELRLLIERQVEREAELGRSLRRIQALLNSSPADMDQCFERLAQSYKYLHKHRLIVMSSRPHTAHHPRDQS